MIYFAKYFNTMSKNKCTNGINYDWSLCIRYVMRCSRVDFKIIKSYYPIRKDFKCIEVYM